MRKKTSSIWTTSNTDLQEIVLRNNSLADVLRELGKDPYVSGSAYRALKDRLKKDGIDFSHIKLGTFSNKGRKFPSEAISLDKVMVKDSSYDRKTLKKRLLEEGLLKNECAICGLPPTWNGTELVMVLDHINGLRNDNRQENLRLLCPNCNSQQSTFSGRANRIPKPKCKMCERIVSRRSKTGLCIECYGRQQPRKVKDRPSQEVLRQKVVEHGYCAVGREYGVSDKCIRKWLKIA